MPENNYQTFSLNNPAEGNTDIEENQSYQKQVTGAFNNQFTSFEEKSVLKNHKNISHQEIDDFINTTEVENQESVGFENNGPTDNG